jgi:hypothetical protein
MKGAAKAVPATAIELLRKNSRREKLFMAKLFG